jgi:hypothetical protein
VSRRARWPTPPSGGIVKKGGMEGLQNYDRVFIWFGRCEDCESVVMLFGRQFQELLFGCLFVFV